MALAAESMSDIETTDWPQDVADAIMEADKSMGHAARRNPVAADASAGKLLSRQTILGAMDHALERHADALRILEARIVATNARVERLELMLHVQPGEALTREV